MTTDQFDHLLPKAFVDGMTLEDARELQIGISVVDRGLRMVGVEVTEAVALYYKTATRRQHYQFLEGTHEMYLMFK